MQDSSPTQPATPPPSYAGPAPPRQKSRVPLLIATIVLVLLLCCCVAAAGLGLYLRALDSEASDDRLAEWEAWEPVAGDVEAVAPDARQRRLADEIVGDVFPACEVEELMVVPGYYDESLDVSLADSYYLRLSVAGDRSTRLAYDCWVAAEAWTANDVTWDEESLDTGEVLATTSGGTEYSYYESDFEGLHGDVPDADYLALLSRVADDWPGGVTVIADVYREDETWADVHVTTWEKHRDEEPLEGVEAEYVLTGGDWRLDWWDWLEDS